MLLMNMQSSAKRVMKVAAGAVLILGVLFGGFYLGVRYGELIPQTVEVKGVANVENNTTGADFGTFWQVWKLIEENYLRDDSISADERVYGSVQGLVSSLGDPHSEFFPPEDNQKFQEDIQGNFGGIGAELGIRRNTIVVIAPIKDTPASRAGIQSGDIILQVNASSTEGLTLDEVVSRIRGPRGTEVTLNMFRDGWERPRDVKLVRETIDIPTLDFTMKEGNIAHVQLYSFNARAEELFGQAVNKVISQGAKGLVLDLRNDPGGYLDVAVDIAGWFVPRGTVVVSEESRIAPKEDLKTNGTGALKDFPMVVLINGGSASASEILAGALRDLRKVQLIGETSFGKGTVQQLFPLRDNASLKLTIAHWVLPSGQILDGVGLKPDIEVTISDEDFNNGRDPQLDKALEVIKTLIK